MNAGNVLRERRSRQRIAKAIALAAAASPGGRPSFRQVLAEGGYHPGSTGSLTKSLRKMRADGLVAFDDRRHRTLRLTPAGEEYAR